MRAGGEAFARTADALGSLAAGDRAAYDAALRAIVADFEARDAHLTGVPIATPRSCSTAWRSRAAWEGCRGRGCCRRASGAAAGYGWRADRARRVRTGGERRTDRRG